MNFYYIGIDNEKAYGVAKKPRTLRIVQNWKKYVAISGAVIILCVTMLIVNSTSTGNALNYGLDFVGGSSIQVTFDNTVPSNSEMEAFVKDTKVLNKKLRPFRQIRDFYPRVLISLDKTTGTSESGIRFCNALDFLQNGQL